MISLMVAILSPGEARAAFAAVILVIVVIVLLTRWACKPERLPPWRKIVNRMPDGEDAEIIEMECGHTCRLIHRRRCTFPCNDCLSEKSQKSIRSLRT